MKAMACKATIAFSLASIAFVLQGCGDTGPVDTCPYFGAESGSSDWPTLGFKIDHACSGCNGSVDVTVDAIGIPPKFQCSETVLKAMAESFCRGFDFKQCSCIAFSSNF